MEMNTERNKTEYEKKKKNQKMENPVVTGEKSMVSGERKKYLGRHPVWPKIEQEQNTICHQEEYYVVKGSGKQKKTR